MRCGQRRAYDYSLQRGGRRNFPRANEEDEGMDTRKVVGQQIHSETLEKKDAVIKELWARIKLFEDA